MDKTRFSKALRDANLVSEQPGGLCAEAVDHIFYKVLPPASDRCDGEGGRGTGLASDKCEGERGRGAGLASDRCEGGPGDGPHLLQGVAASIRQVRRVGTGLASDRYENRARGDWVGVRQDRCEGVAGQASEGDGCRRAGVSEGCTLASHLPAPIPANHSRIFHLLSHERSIN